jgi:hypothetical protein
MKRVLMIEDSALVLKALLDVFYPRWSPFSLGEVLRRAFTAGVIRPGTKVVAISGMPTSNEQTTPKC